MKNLINNKFVIIVFIVGLALIMVSFNKSKNENHNTDKTDLIKPVEGIIKIEINKNTTDKEIGNIMISLNEKGIKTSFTNIKRNEVNEIIAINIDVTKNGSTSSFQASSDVAISKIIIDIDGDFVSIYNEGIQIFGIGSNDELAERIKKQMSFINDKIKDIDKEVLKNNIQEQIIAFKDKFGNIDELKKMMEKQKELFSYFNFDKNDFDRFFSENNSSGLQNPEKFSLQKETKSTYIVNGKKMSKEEYEKMDKSKINSLEIRKEVIKTYKK